MVNVPRRFPCGEYFPGEEPRTPPTRGIDSLPQIFIPTRPRYEPPFFPPVITPPDEYWACVGESPGDYFALGGKRCLPCTGLRFGPGGIAGGIATGVDASDRRCIHLSLAECVINCRRPRDPEEQTKFACIGFNDQFLLGGRRCVPCSGFKTNPAGIVVAVNETDPKCIHESLVACVRLCPRGRRRDNDNQTPPGGGGSFGKCVETIIQCPPPRGPNGTYTPDELAALPIRQILRVSATCDALEADLDITDASGIYPFDPAGAYPADNTKKSSADGFCLPESITSDSFWAGCINSRILNDCITEPSNNQYASRPRITTTDLTNNSYTTNTEYNSPGRLTTASQSLERRAGSIVDPNSFAASIINLIPKKQSTQLKVDENSLSRFSSSSGSISDNLGLFDETYNFFRTYPPRETTLISNSQYLNIFNTSVAEEVKYFLNRNNTSSAWHEKIVNDLTPDKIVISLKSDILTAISNLHSVGNERISFDDLITAIKSHLIAGTMDELDVNYYFHVYNTQVNDSLITIDPLGESKEGIQFSLAVFELSSQTPDYSRYSDLRIRNDYKRMRVLLEDIDTNIPTTLIDGTVSTVYLRNAGIPTELIDSPSSFMDIGDGAGYYVSSIDIQNIEYPLLTTNELSSSKYLPPFPRHAVLKTLGTDPGLVINVSSNTTGHEFAQDYNPSADVYPMYFKLNFDELSDVESPNSVVNVLSATYTRLTDEEGKAHSRNYSFNIIKINMDYRDPLIHYARDTSTIDVELDDFNLRSFDENLTPVSRNIILRNFPAAVILSPGLGTTHNPFNTRSVITNYGEPVVVRSLEVTPSFDVNDVTKSRPPLNISNVYNTLGTAYFGLYEKFFDQDIHGDIFTYDPSSSIFEKSYFFNGGYSNTQPASSFREGSIESKVAIGVVDKLANSTGVSELTYWDVYRRLRINDIGKLALVQPKSLMRKLESGWRNNVPIKYVLSRNPIRPTGIPEGTTIANDEIIINEGDRQL